jgi:hypothetical protein
MKFVALPVNVGDSFLLTADDKIILVDGGMNKRHILTLLRKQKIPGNHIDLLVCTHYDADHVNGILGILESQKYTFREIWLPEILGSIGYTLSKSVESLFIAIRKHGVAYSGELNDETPIFTQYPSEELKQKEVPGNNSFEQIDCGILDELYSDRGYWPYYPYWILDGHETSSKIVYSAKTIAELVSRSVRSGAYVRWFKYEDDAIPQTYGFDMFCQNSIQTDISIFDRDLLLKALCFVSLSPINKYSLVFLHRKSEVPDILFTADSDLSFYSNPVKLHKGSIVTSPHHGSSVNDSAYKNIVGDDLIFVRSDRSQLARPGSEYLRQKTRYCTICRNKKSKQEVGLVLNGATFFTNASACNC